MATERKDKKGNKKIKNKKVLMILSNPLMVDPRVFKEAKTLVEEGSDVAVIVWDRHKEYPSEDIIDGIKIMRIHNEGLMRILPNDLFRNPVWWINAYKKGLELYKNGYKFDVVHCHDLDTLQSGVWLKKKLGVKLIYDAHEIFGYMIEETAPYFVCKFAFYMEKKLIKKVDQIITVDKPFKNYFTSISNTPVSIVMNCKDLVYDTFESPNNPLFTLVYVGIMTKGRFFPEIIDLMGQIKGVKLIIAGKKEGLFFEMEKYARDFDNVEFLGTVPSEEILPLTRKADATFIIPNPSSKQHQMTVFNKQFEAMVCGRPIIVTKGTYAGQMTEELQCGLTVEYSEESVKEAILLLRDNPELCEKLGRNAFKAARERYNWDNEKKKLLGVYEEII